jgi:putative ABC transport system ATP-binding protein
MTASDNPLEVRSLIRVFRLEDEEISVLEGVTFKVQPGEFVAVMGQSGSGKSTLLHIIAGLLPATAGQVFLKGEEVTALPEAGRARLRRKELGYIFQNFNLMPHLTVEENVTLPLRIAREKTNGTRHRVEELLRAVRLSHRTRHRPHQLSGGELQRVSIARALAARPDVILADEPTGNLSSLHGEEVMHLLRESIGDDERSLLLVTHNPYDAAQADRVLFLKDGRMEPAWELGPGEVNATSVLDRLKELGI